MAWLRRQISCRPPIAVSILLLTAALTWLALIALALGPLPLFDLKAALQGGLDWERGLDPYLTALNDPGSLVTTGSGFVYPPYTLPLFAIMASVGDLAVKAWQIAGLVSLGWLVWDLSAPRSAARVAVLATLAAFFYPAITNLIIGQPGLMTIGAAWLAIRLLTRGSDRAAGAALALASFAKLFPLIGLCLFAFARRWFGIMAAIALMAAAALLTLPMTLSLWPQYVTGVLLQKAAIANAFPTSQSLVAVATRLLTNNPFEASFLNAPGLAHLTGTLLSLLAFSIVAFFAWRTADTDFGLAGAMLLAVLPLALPHSWQHYHVLALPLLLLVANQALLRGDWSLGAIAILGLGLMSIVPALMDHNVWSIASWPPLLQALCMNSTVLGTTLVLATSIVRMNRGERPQTQSAVAA